jgi:anthranilate synthase component 2
MLLLIDNYDSFTFNLVQRFGEIAADLPVEVHRNDCVTGDEIARKSPSHLVISPGPCTPSEAGVSCDVVRRFAGRMPILGVCLGHQSIGQVFGGTIVRAKRLMHGKVDRIEHSGKGLFAGLASPIEATRYHSLVIDPPTLPKDFEVDAWSTAADGSQEIMAIRHKSLPVYGLQFHPESFLTPAGLPRRSRSWSRMPGPCRPGGCGWRMRSAACSHFRSSPTSIRRRGTVR